MLHFPQGCCSRHRVLAASQHWPLSEISLLIGLAPFSLQVPVRALAYKGSCLWLKKNRSKDIRCLKKSPGKQRTRVGGHLHRSVLIWAPLHTHCCPPVVTWRWTPPLGCLLLLLLLQDLLIFISEDSLALASQCHLASYMCIWLVVSYVTCCVQSTSKTGTLSVFHDGEMQVH